MKKAPDKHHPGQRQYKITSENDLSRFFFFPLTSYITFYLKMDCRPLKMRIKDIFRRNVPFNFLCNEIFYNISNVYITLVRDFRYIKVPLTNISKREKPIIKERSFYGYGL